jgi:hypothetical protein
MTEQDFRQLLGDERLLFFLVILQPVVGFGRAGFADLEGGRAVGGRVDGGGDMHGLAALFLAGGHYDRIFTERIADHLHRLCHCLGIKGFQPHGRNLLTRIRLDYRFSGNRFPEQFYYNLQEKWVGYVDYTAYITLINYYQDHNWGV